MNILSDEQKKKIILLRENGDSYNDINNTLSLQVPKSTLSYICKDVIMSQEYKDKYSVSQKLRLIGFRELALKKNFELLELRKVSAKHRALKKFNGTSKDMSYIALVMLYWGEGGKWPSRSGLYLGSSDYKMLQVYIGLLQLCFNINADSLKARVQLRYDQDIELSEAFWADKLKINRDNFYPAYKDKKTKGSKTIRKDYHGVCSLTCKGADIQLELQAAADIINKAWGISSVG